MSTDLHTQIHDYAGYFGSTLPDIDLESLLTQPVAPQQLPRPKPPEPRRPRWAVALAAGVVVLLLVGGIAWLAGVFGGNAQPVIQPSPTSVPTTPVPSTTTPPEQPGSGTTLAGPATVTDAPEPLVGQPTGRIVFQSSSQDGSYLWAVDANGEELVRLTDDSLRPFGPKWSPDGTHIAFNHDARCSVPITPDNDRGFVSCFEIYVMEADGSNLTRLTESAVNATFQVWSPDSSRIAFTSRDGVHVINTDGTGLFRLTDGAEILVWSRDGSRIGFEDAGWFIINSDGTGLTRLADVPPGAGVFSPSLTRIAFYENLYGDEGEPSLSVINIDGAVTRLTELPRLDPQMPAFPGDLTPVWSPDESKLAFTTCAENLDEATLFCRLYVVNADGSGLVPLGDGEFPAWSRDGSHLAFTEMGTFLADTGEGNRDMYIVGVDGSGLTRLTENLGTFTRYPSWFQSSNE